MYVCVCAWREEEKKRGNFLYYLNKFKLGTIQYISASLSLYIYRER